ncbi:MAG: hypothetical protein JW809_08285 [Pirellulales bacterium]|nr:hypothetical protein [Pirellulales bacterium]
MCASQDPAVTRFEELKAGDRIEVEHAMTIGPTTRPVRTVGTVVRTERRLQGMHFARHHDDEVFTNAILIELPDGELTTVTMDEFTVLRRS